MGILTYIDGNLILITSKFLIGLYSLDYLSSWYSPRAHAVTTKFFHLQHVTDVEGGRPIYDIHIDDIYYVVYWVVVLTFVRSALMQYVFMPVAKNLCNIHSRKAKVRFAEQSWSIFYYCGSFSLGFYLYYYSPYWKNLDHIFIAWPHDRMSGLYKSYYLISIAFWLHQVLVLNIEVRRKDHYQMFSHHIITCALVISSYYYYYTRIGSLILMIMDSVDIFLSTAKVLKYSGFSTLCDYVFFCFLCSWVLLRHGVYNYLFYHTWKYASELMKDSRCVPGVEQKRCWTPTVVNTFLCLLGGLQFLTCIWMYLILKVAAKVIRGQSAEDVRSDEDDTDVESTKDELRETTDSSVETLTEMDEKS